MKFDKSLQLKSPINPFGMDQFVLTSYSVYQSQNTLPKKPKLEHKQEKEEIVREDFGSIYRALNAMLKRVTICILLL